ncbi:MAG TPA: PAS-domain containing protein [Rhizomicrobium sp.]|nr:PAS-domain containing protein [Rhizomicrobium sp.]
MGPTELLPALTPEPDLACLPQALDALRVAITVHDAALKLVYANQHYNYLFRAMPDRQTLLGIDYAALIALEVSRGEIANAELIAGVDPFIARRVAQLRPGQFHPMDIALRDGRVAELKARQTQQGGWIVVWSDVTAARHALMRFEDVTELSTDALAFFDRHERLIACNDGYRQLIGVANADTLKGRSFAEIYQLALDSGKFEREPAMELRLALHRKAVSAYRLHATSGETYLVRDRLTRDGGRAVIFTDVTDTHRTEAALNQQTAALARSRKAMEALEAQTARQADYLADLTKKLGAVEAEAGTAKTALLRTMSHELKTPLNAIIGFADLLRKPGAQWSPEKIEEYAGLIHTGGHNLLRLLNQILDLTRIAGGRYAVYRARLDGGAILRAMPDCFAERARAKSIRIDVSDCAPGVLADADESALRVILSQLIDNALTFTPAGGTIRLQAVSANARVRFVVADTGPGVAAADLARILEPFEQGARSISDHQGGAGLGLTLAKALAELQGGGLTVQSAEGEGFTAVVELLRA